MPLKTEISANYQDPDEATGQSTLPRARIMKIIKTDDDVYQCNKQATYLVSVATEMFIQYLAEQGVKSLAAERKQRKTVQYKDLANAVARIDNLEFLSDVIPQVVTVKQARETKIAKSKKNQSTTETGQLTLSELLGAKSVHILTTPEPKTDGDSGIDTRGKSLGEAPKYKDKGNDVDHPESPNDEQDEDVIME